MKLGKLFQTVVIAVAGVYTGGAVTAAAWIGAGMFVLSAVYLDRQQRKASQRAAQDAQNAMSAQTQMIKAPTESRRVVYGKNVKVSGVILMTHMEGVNTRYIVLGVAAHGLGFKHDLYVDDVYCAPSDFTVSGNWYNCTKAPWAGYLSVAWIDQGTTAFAGLTSEIPAIWTADHKLTGCAYMVLKLAYNANTFPNGMPAFATRADGKLCTDPRDSSTSRTENAAIALYDYLTNTTYGLGESTANIDSTLMNSACNTCDQVVAVDGETRYKIYGSFTLDEKPVDILDKSLDACAGKMPYAGGKWRLMPGAYIAPTITLDENDIVGPMTINPKASRRDIFNTVQGVFWDTGTDQPADYPIVKSTPYITLDGETIPFQLDLQMVKQPGQAQRIAGIVLKKSREELSCIMPVMVNQRTLNLIAGCTVMINNTRMGWSSKVFEVRSWDLEIQGNALIINLGIFSISSGVYSDDTVLTFTASPSTTQPSPWTMLPPTNLALTETLIVIGDVVHNKVVLTWTAPATYFVDKFKVIYYKTGGSFQGGGSLPANTTRQEIILDDVGEYNFYVQAYNALGAQAAALIISTLVGKTAPPADVTGFTAVIQGEKVRLSWNAIADLDLDHYKISVGATYAGSTLIGNYKLTNVLLDGLTAGTYKYWIVALDTGGPGGLPQRPSTNPASVSITIAVPSTPSVSSALSDNQIILTWPAVTSSFPIDYYEIKEGATSFGKSKTTSFKLIATAAAVHTYSVVAYDTAGNASSAGTVGPTISVPATPADAGTKAEFNKIQFRYSNCKTTFNIKNYDFYRGTAFTGSTHIGNSDSTAFTFIEAMSGAQVYWIVATDIYGNSSSPMQISLTITNPPDFKFITDYADDFVTDAILTSCLKESYANSYGLTAPINTTKTWADYIADFGDVVPTKSLEEIYPQATGQYIKQWDTGASVTSGGSLQLLYNILDLSGGAITVTPTISLSTDNVIWTDYAGVTALTITDAFRYIKITLDFAGGGVGKLVQITNLFVKMYLQRKYIYGNATFDGTGLSTIDLSSYSFIDIDQVNFTAIDAAIKPVQFNVSGCWGHNPTTMTAERYNNGTLGAGASKYEIIAV